MKKGFTLIELLVFIAIFTLIIGSFIAILVSVVNIQTKQVAISEIEQQGQFLTQQIQYYIQSARLIDMPLDTATTTLTLREATSSVSPTIFSVSSGTVYLTQGIGGTPQALTSNKVTITNVSFTRHYNLNSTSSAYGADSVSYSFTVVAGNNSIVSNGTSSTYSYSRSITVSSNASGTNTNFPMLFSGTYSWLAASSSAGKIQNLTTAPNGSQEPADLIFGSNSTCSTPLNFETESYTSSTGAINDWVNVPSLSSGSVIYACYGNGSVATDQSHPSSTWNTNFQGVWHLASPTSTVEGNDSTVNGNMGTLVNSPTTIIGQIGNGMNLVAASNQYLNTNDVATPTAASYEAWIKPASFPNAYNAIFEKNDSTEYMDLHVKSNGTLACYLVGTGGGIDYDGTGINTLAAGTWYHVVMTYDSVNGIKCYVNGSLDGSVAPAGNLAAIAAPLYIGSDRLNSPRYFNGVIDEARFSTVALSPSWILTEYNNQSSPSTFYTVGSESTNPSFNNKQLLSELFQSSVAVPAPVAKIALIQQVKGENNSASVSSIATTYPSSNEVGDLLIAVVANNGIVTSSIADSQGNTWSLVASTTYSLHSDKLSVYAALNAKAGLNTVTTTFASGASYASVFLYEYRGASMVSSFDKWAGQIQAATTTPLSGIVNPTSTAELLLGINYNANTTEVPSPGAGYTLETSSTVNNTTQVFVEDQDQYISGSVSAGWKYTGTPDSTAMIVTFR